MPYITESEYSKLQGELLEFQYNEKKLEEDRDHARAELQKQLDRNDELEKALRGCRDILKSTCIPTMTKAGAHVLKIIEKNLD